MRKKYIIFLRGSDTTPVKRYSGAPIEKVESGTSPVHPEESHEGDTRNHVVFRGEIGDEEVRFELPYAQAANALMSAKGFCEYVKEHGYHFTEHLAEHVSRMMVNGNGKEHTWTAAQVKKSMETMGMQLPEKTTWGDVTYLANMYYADLFPNPIKDEPACLCAAFKTARDVDGYEGMVFCRWTSDAIGKAVHIDWEDFC